MKAIAAMSNNRVIGCNGRIPWHIPEDLKWFKECTMDGIVVVGRKTAETLPDLPGREVVVLSKGSRPPQHYCDYRLWVPSLGSGFLLANGVWLAGGGQVYSEYLPSCTDLYLTRVDREVEGDTFFPPFEDRFTLKGVVRSGEGWKVEHWANNETTP